MAKKTGMTIFYTGQDGRLHEMPDATVEKLNEMDVVVPFVLPGEPKNDDYTAQTCDGCGTDIYIDKQMLDTLEQLNKKLTLCVSCAKKKAISAREQVNKKNEAAFNDTISNLHTCKPPLIANFLPTL